MHYDIAAKVILARCKETVLRELYGLPVKSAHLSERAWRSGMGSFHFIFLVNGLKRLNLEHNCWQIIPLCLKKYLGKQDITLKG